MEKRREAVLKKYVFDDTKTVQLLDEFEGIGEKNRIIYDRIILKNKRFGTTEEGIRFYYKLVIERSKRENYVGDITFTKFKKGEDAGLRKYISQQVKSDIIKKFANTNEIFYFGNPYLLRAQNSNNRTGYGWEWDWSGGIGIPYEGTLYGETTHYIFAGVLIEED